jgi:hypothetical protein
MLDKAEGPVQPTIADTQAGHGVTVCSGTYILPRPAGSYLQSEHCLEQPSGKAFPEADQQILNVYQEQCIVASASFQIETALVA